MNDLSISGLDAGYGGQPIISGFSLPPLTTGEVVSVVGPNGAGKSTLLRSLAGLIPAHGSIRLDEAELTRLSLADRAKRVTYMPQTLPQGVALTVLETVVASIRATPLRGAVSPTPRRPSAPMRCCNASTPRLWPDSDWTGCRVVRNSWRV